MPTVTGTEDRSRARRNQKSLEERAGARRSSRLKRHFGSRPYKTQARRHCLDGKRAGMHPEGGIARERENKTERDRDMKRHREMEKEREREREGERERERQREGPGCGCVGPESLTTWDMAKVCALTSILLTRMMRLSRP